MDFKKRSLDVRKANQRQGFLDDRRKCVYFLRLFFQEEIDIQHKVVSCKTADRKLRSGQVLICQRRFYAYDRRKCVYCLITARDNFIDFNHQKQFQQEYSMLRRSLQLSLPQQTGQHPQKQHDYSPSTADSGSPRNFASPPLHKSSIRKDKEKSQLCKKYLEFGFCPYEKKCKFAHGSHQLRKNQQVNSKYKTKECGVFLTQGYCMYGERCNFIHTKVCCKKQAGLGDALFQEVRTQSRGQSRLLALLNSI